jgi:3-hydroxyisobutyrate dehydrogenase
MALARKSGLDLRTMVEVVSAGAGGSWQLANLGPKIAEGDHDPGFKIDLMLKDLGLVEEAAQTQGLKLEVTALAHAYLAAVAEQGGGGLGTQAMAKALEQIGDFAFGD